MAVGLVILVFGLSRVQAGEAKAIRKNPEVPVHYIRDTSVLLPRFRNVLAPGTEYRAEIEIEGKGTFTILFFPETAPNHVANFISLARAGFYDSVTFHRVIPNFVAQGGDPTGTGRGGPGYTIPAEFSNLPHERGTVSMARAFDPNSAGSQFFICFRRLPFLDGKYTVFGKVIEGMDVVDRIRKRDPQRRPDYPGDRIRSIRILERTPPPPPDPAERYPGIEKNVSREEEG
ncbi:MAG: peptidylprolyl isomerase [Candidatus Hydrogenedentota bacterium]|nr:MAG: peptidylprolyl isomerase [Candidatus Hydrogenedentota bacterium]